MDMTVVLFGSEEVAAHNNGRKDMDLRKPANVRRLTSNIQVRQFATESEKVAYFEGVATASGWLEVSEITNQTHLQALAAHFPDVTGRNVISVVFGEYEANAYEEDELDLSLDSVFEEVSCNIEYRGFDNAADVKAFRHGVSDSCGWFDYKPIDDKSELDVILSIIVPEAEPAPTPAP